VGKRSNFPRMEKDYYVTPKSAVLPLLPFLSPRTLFAEPCAGSGELIDHLVGEGHKCVWATDVAPRRPDVAQTDARTIDEHERFRGTTTIITNPPWTRSLMHPIIEHLSSMYRCWFLFDADWMHTKQSSELIKKCDTIISVGRVKWMPDTPYVGKDNCCWYRFLPGHADGPRFVGR
jgi:hypothetical protein